jgi:hypothetical protein
MKLPNSMHNIVEMVFWPLYRTIYTTFSPIIMESAGLLVGGISLQFRVDLIGIAPDVLCPSSLTGFMIPGAAD